MKGRKVPQVEQIPAVSPPKTLTWETMQDALKMYAGVPYTATHKLTIEGERQQKCQEVAERIYVAMGQWLLPEILKLTEPEIDKALMTVPFRLPEPTPAERGILDRYQDRRRRR